MARRSYWSLLLLYCADGFAGEIPGIPSPLPPTIDRKLEFNFGNDFLGRGGSTDDFRTQQLMLSSTFDERWIATIDHSILTLEQLPGPARIDQLSATLGYRLIDAQVGDRFRRLTVGGGLRSAGDFAGDRIQNGFHRLVSSEVILRRYTDTDRTDATVWADGDYYALLGDRADDWRFGYWLHGSTMYTSDGQWDGSAGALAVARRDAFDAWLGLRRDWRSGYDGDPVLSRTAEEEDDLAVAVGVRWGTLVFESVQQLDNNSSYGQFRIVSGGGDGSFTIGDLNLGMEVGLLMPDIHARLAVRYPAFGNSSESRWRRSLVFEAVYGEPQYKNNPSLYVLSGQLAVGVEWETPIPGREDRATVYGSIGAGYRSEQLDGDSVRDGQRSNTVGSAIITMGLGTRFDTARIGARWRYRLQLGLNGWIPLQDDRFTIVNQTFSALRPALAAVLAVSFDRS